MTHGHSSILSRVVLAGRSGAAAADGENWSAGPRRGAAGSDSIRWSMLGDMRGRVGVVLCPMLGVKTN